MSRESSTPHGAPPTGRRPPASGAGGFTLIEAMVTVAVIGTMAIFAYPTYTSYRLETGRGDAYAALLDLATREETHYNTYNTYTDVIAPPHGCAGADCGLRANGSSPEGYYELSAGPGRTNDLATSFVLTATVKPGQRQEGDDGCTVLTINWLGETKPAECW